LLEFRQFLDGLLDAVGNFQLDFFWRGTGIWGDDDGFFNSKIRIL
jgi:hypothetical protein